jgi:hypothetical protein
MKTENVDYFQIQINTNRQERDEFNLTNDDVFQPIWLIAHEKIQEL